MGLGRYVVLMRTRQIPSYATKAWRFSFSSLLMRNDLGLEDKFLFSPFSSLPVVLFHFLIAFFTVSPSQRDNEIEFSISIRGCIQSSPVAYSHPNHHQFHLERPSSHSPRSQLPERNRSSHCFLFLIHLRMMY